jgi:hypothetical protein
MRSRPQTVTVAAALLAVFSLASIISPLLPSEGVPPAFVIYLGIVLGIAGLVVAAGLWMLTVVCVSIDLQLEHVVLSPRTAIRGFRRSASIASSVSRINLYEHRCQKVEHVACDRRFGAQYPVCGTGDCLCAKRLTASRCHNNGRRFCPHYRAGGASDLSTCFRSRLSLREARRDPAIEVLLGPGCRTC